MPSRLFNSLKPKIYWALMGSLLSLGSPIGLWILSQFFFIESHNLMFVYIYTTVGTFISFTSFGFWLGIIIEKSNYLATHDQLTNIYNRRYMQERLIDIYSFSQRYKKPILLCMLDLDNFKRVNDTYGHLAGDHVLKKVSKEITKTCRKSDIISRWGGEEFIIYFPQTSFEQAGNLTERIRKNVEKLSAEELGISGNQTVSIGMIYVDNVDKTTLNTIIFELDHAMYSAKENGRNNVVSKNI